MCDSPRISNASFIGLPREADSLRRARAAAHRRFDANLLERIAALDLRDRTDREIAREDAVHAAGDDAFPEVDRVVVRYVFHDQQRLTLAPNGALGAGIGQHRANAALLVRQQKHLRGIRIGFDDFADHAIWSDDSHVFPDAVALAAVQLNRLAGGSRTRANHPRGDHGDPRVRLAEIQQCGQAVSFRGFALKLRDLQFQCVVLMANLLVFLGSVLQRKVVAPGVANPPEAVGTGAFERRSRADGPDANQPSLRLALDLHGQQQHLQYDDSGEQDQRFVARRNGDHWAIFSWYFCWSAQ